MSDMQAHYKCHQSGKFEVFTLLNSTSTAMESEVYFTNIPDSLDLPELFFVFMQSALVQELRLSVKDGNIGKIGFVKLQTEEDASRLISALNGYEIRSKQFLRFIMCKSTKEISLKGCSYSEEEIKIKIQECVNADVKVENYTMVNESAQCMVLFNDHYDSSFFKFKLKLDMLSVFPDKVTVSWSLEDEVHPNKKKKIWTDVEIKSCASYIYRSAVKSLTYMHREFSNESEILAYIKSMLNINFQTYLEDVQLSISDAELDKQREIFQDIMARRGEGLNLGLNERGTTMLKGIIKDLETVSLKIKTFID